MSPDAWQQISVWFLRFGFLFLIAFVICSIKFDLISMIKSEIYERKNRRFSDNESYFAYVEEKNRENSGGQTREAQSLSYASATAVSNRIPEEPPSSATVVVSRWTPEIPPASGTVVSHRAPEEPETGSEFTLLENIMVIHGNPELIHKNGSHS